MTRDEAIAAAEKAYPKEFLDFGDCRSDNRSECKLLIDRLAALGVITLSDVPAPPPQVDSGREEIARIIDPISFNQGLQGYKGWEPRRAIALEKADAILALRPERSGSQK